MGLIIVSLMILIVYGMIQKAKNPDFSFFSANDKTIVSAGDNTTLQKILLNLPSASTIQSTDDMGQGRMAIRVDTDGTNGADTIIIIDINSGKIISQIGINP